jgi:DNA-binding transcriptional LysR family regulator
MIRAETDDISLLIDLAARGLGVAVVPGTGAQLLRPDLIALALHRPKLARRTLVAWHRHRPTRPALAFLGYARAGGGADAQDMAPSGG